MIDTLRRSNILFLGKMKVCALFVIGVPLKEGCLLSEVSRLSKILLLTACLNYSTAENF